jgi:transposase
MHVVYERCAAIDVGKDEIAVAVRMPGDGPDGRVTVKRTFRTFYGVMGEAARWLVSLGVTQVAMEATGIYSMPVYYALVEHGDFARVLICNAAHVKNVPGRKTDYADAEWLAHLLECGLLAGSFIPPAEIKAARDVIRYRAKIVQQRVSEIARLGGTLQDAGIKTGSVASLIATKSGRAMIEALTGGERRGPVLAQLAKGTMRSKIADLSMALEGRFSDHHALMCRLHLDHIDYLEAAIARLDARIEVMMEPFQCWRDLLATVPGIGRHASAALISEIGIAVGEFFPGDAHLASWTGLCPGNHESAGKRRSGKPRKGQHAPAELAGRMRLVRGPPRRLPQVPLPPARHEERRLPQLHRQEESHRRGGPRDDRDHLAHHGHRKALPRARRRLLHQPPGPRTRDPPAHRQTPGPRAHRHHQPSRLTASHRKPCHDLTGQGPLPPAQLRTIHVSGRPVHMPDAACWCHGSAVRLRATVPA